MADLGYLISKLENGDWFGGGTWEFDWYLDLIFLEEMAYGTKPIQMSYEQPIIGDEFLKWSGEEQLRIKYKYFFNNKEAVLDLIESQKRILNKAGQEIAHLENMDLNYKRYRTVQGELSQLMASVSVIFDWVISNQVSILTEKYKADLQDVTNYVTAMSAKTVLNESNNKLIGFFNDNKSAFENSAFKLTGMGINIRQWLKEHADKYGWLNTGERGSHEWSKKDFLEQMKNLVEANNKYQAISLNHQLQNELSPLITINTYDNQAADYQIHMDYLFQKFLKKTMKGDYVEDIVQNLSFSEIIFILERKKSITDFGSRRNNYLRAAWPINGRFETYYFENYGEFKKLKAKISKQVFSDQVQGMVACRGNVEGVVKIIKVAKDLDNFESGQIMVAEITQPKYVMAMAKAAAIVTDIGGITSHAAIISREFGIPCIVGTNNATKVLKNGDFVVVDAILGTVQKK